MCAVEELWDPEEGGVVGALEGVVTPGSGAIESDVLGLTTAAGAGAEEEEDGVDAAVGVGATGDNGAGVTAGAGVTDALGVVSLYVIFLTTLSIKDPIEIYKLPTESNAMRLTPIDVAVALTPSTGVDSKTDSPVPATVVIIPVLAVTIRTR